MIVRAPLSRFPFNYLLNDQKTYFKQWLGIIVDGKDVCNTVFLKLPSIFCISEVAYIKTRKYLQILGYWGIHGSQ